MVTYRQSPLKLVKMQSGRLVKRLICNGFELVVDPKRVCFINILPYYLTLLHTLSIKLGVRKKQ